MKKSILKTPIFLTVSSFIALYVLEYIILQRPFNRDTEMALSILEVGKKISVLFIPISKIHAIETEKSKVRIIELLKKSPELTLGTLWKLLVISYLLLYAMCEVLSSFKL